MVFDGGGISEEDAEVPSIDHRDGTFLLHLWDFFTKPDGMGLSPNRDLIDVSPFTRGTSQFVLRAQNHEDH
jgi:hypothetical protein